MKALISTIVFVVLLSLTVSCGRDTTLVLSSAHDAVVLVAQEKEVMEHLIDCAITGVCNRPSAAELLPSRGVFLVSAGTRVAVNVGFTFSAARKIHILEGDYSGREGWVYERMLCKDVDSLRRQQTFARLFSSR
jgi:hypothetical protein